jgi:hypothetical protein
MYLAIELKSVLASYRYPAPKKRFVRVPASLPLIAKDAMDGAQLSLAQ